jgi:hypothetical protein
MSKVTVLVPFVMQTLVELLLGYTAGLQSPLVFQLLLPAMLQVVGLLRVHWPSAEGAEKQTTASRTTIALAKRTARLSCFSWVRKIVDDIIIVLPAFARRLGEGKLARSFSVIMAPTPRV